MQEQCENNTENIIEPDGAIELSHALMCNSTLTELDLYGQTIVTFLQGREVINLWVDRKPN